MVLFEIVYSWFIEKVLDKILSIFKTKKTKEKENELFLEVLEENLNFRSDLTQKEKEVIIERTKNKEWEMAISLLKNRSLLKENIIRRYSSPLPIILLQYGNQKIENRKNKFVTEKLEKDYNVKSLGGSLKAIPPNKVPKYIKNGLDLKNWFEKKIQAKYKNSSCIISVLAIVDLKNVYWKSDYEYEARYFKPLGQVLNLEDIFEKKEIPKLLASENISILEQVLSGDISFLTSNFLSDREMSIIYKNQEDIEKKINMALLQLSKKESLHKIKTVLSEYFNNSDELAKRLNREAKFWLERLNNKNEATK